MAERAKCPECGERVRVPRSDKRVRCPECGKSFRPEDEDEDDHDEKPRRADRKSADRKTPNRLPWYIGGGLLLAGVVVALALLLRGKGGPAADSARVTVENFRRVKAGMEQSEVDAILGGGAASSENDMRGAFRSAFGEGGAAAETGWSRMSGATSWRRWDGKTVRAWVAFAEASDGKLRAAYSLALEQPASGPPVRHPGVETYAGNTDLAQLGEQRKKEAGLRDDPKWVRGPEARQLLLGEWREKKATGYTFHPGDKLTTYTFDWKTQDSTFRVLDDRHVEIITPSPFAGPTGAARRYEFLVNADELVLLDEATTSVFPILGPYCRMPARPGNLTHTRVVVPLLDDLKKPKGPERNLAFEHLRILGGGAASALPTVVELIASPDPETAGAAIRVAGAMRGAGGPAVPELAKSLRRADRNLQYAAVLALGQIGPAAKDALPDLRALATSTPDGNIRREAEGIIRDIEGGKP